MRVPPESTTVKAPLSAANFLDSSAVYLASEIATSSSVSKVRRLLFGAAAEAGAAAVVAIAAADGECARRRGGEEGTGPDHRRLMRWTCVICEVSG
jgi:hypothetical protein